MKYNPVTQDFNDKKFRFWQLARLISLVKVSCVGDLNLWILGPQIAINIFTCTCHPSGSWSLRQGSSLTVKNSGIFSIETKASSYVAFTFLMPLTFEAFSHRSSKFFKTSYAAGPSILLCKSCHGSLGEPATLP